MNLTTLLLFLVLLREVTSDCCGATDGMCGDGSKANPYCGYGPCNIFGCNCDGGCRKVVSSKSMTVALVRDSTEICCHALSTRIFPFIPMIVGIAAKAIIKVAIKQGIKYVAKEIAKKAIKHTVKETAKAIKHTVKETGKAITETAKETAKVIKDNAKEHAEGIKDTAKKTAKKNIEKALEETAKVAIKEENLKGENIVDEVIGAAKDMSSIPRCADGTQPTPYCGVGKCNIRGCNCDGGCRK